ncbi:hypothetical protein [Chryseobacterium oryzae]|uniref:Uncharacterized protein n=1 Tax=Chryseobacterium oryzae TaxID=2929799 RepID=A0ABY4BLD4_9FLAO|nr:hypothetical protein [Chryseobacterium oryzae]UOE39699.1 hypothetical protein MTP08_14500 [Chryseobacterium oryzae]
MSHFLKFPEHSFVNAMNKRFFTGFVFMSFFERWKIFLFVGDIKQTNQKVFYRLHLEEKLKKINMENIQKDSKSSIVKLGLVLGFIVAMSALLICWDVFDKAYKSKDETEFKINNKMIGEITLKKKISSGSDPP